ncbi:MAG: histidine kinase [Pseudomonadota bacterium]|nr:histidine kinase [Pseudomonadota bacterium]
MTSALKHLLQPLNLAGLVTITAVGLTLPRNAGTHSALAFALLAVFALLMLLSKGDTHGSTPRTAARDNLRIVAMALVALVLFSMFPRGGAMPIVTVVLAAVMAGTWPPLRVALALLAFNVLAAGLLHRAGANNPLLSMLLIGCFQLFAALTVHYARNAEQARDRLALINADLLATRALLADSSRDAERLRVARELHDVAGHKLTALRLNLRALSSDANAAPQLQLAEQLSAELLSDIRGVVDALRDVDGLDIATALHAIAAPFPSPRLQLMIGDDVQITDPALADTVLRLVQEALTNSAKHADAQQLHVALSQHNHTLQLNIEDDGEMRGAFREGNGLTGMRERVEERGGHIAFARNPQHALQISAELPA